MTRSDCRITIDDLGLLPGVEASAIELSAYGVPIHCSWMTNYFPPSARVRSIANLKPGLHFNVLEGKSEIPTPALTDKDGMFSRRWADFLLAGRAMRAQVDAQFEYQYAKAKTWFPVLHHVDTHVHLHLIPWLYEMLQKKRAKHGFELVRNPYQPLLDRPVVEARMVPKMLIVGVLRRFVRPEGMPCFGVSETFQMDVEHSKAALKRGARELIWHTYKGDDAIDESKYRFTTASQLDARRSEHETLKRFLVSLKTP